MQLIVQTGRAVCLCFACALSLSFALAQERPSTLGAPARTGSPGVGEGVSLRSTQSLGVSVHDASASGPQQNALVAMSASVQGGMETLRIDFSGRLAALPDGFVVQSPARISLDFPGLSNLSGQSSFEFNLPNLKSAKLAHSERRFRVVLNLNQAAGYRATVRDKSLFLTLEPLAEGAAVAMAVAPALRQPEAVADSAASLRNLDFIRGADGAGRLVIDLTSPQVRVDLKQQGSSLVLDFLQSGLSPAFKRRLDVSDFSTPVKFIHTTSEGDRVRLQVETAGAVEHSAYQRDNQYVLEVRPQQALASTSSKTTGYTGEKLSFNFQNIEVRSLLQVIADFTNFNVVTSDAVTGSVTLRLKDVPWDQALDIILQAKNLGMKKSGTVLWIAPKEELMAKEKQELETRAAMQTLEPLRSQSIQLNYSKASDVVAQIGASTGSGANATRLLSARGSVVAEPRTNQIFVTDVPAKLEEVQALIAKLDIPVRQVMIEARIVEASDQFGKSLGVKFGGGNFGRGNSVGGGNRINWGPSYTGVPMTTRPDGTTPFLEGKPEFNGNADFLNLPAVGQNGFNAASLGLLLFNAAGSRLLNLELSALEGEGKGRIVSNPRIVTADQVKALIEQGTELPYQVATSSGATSIAFRKANLKLEVTPQITPEGDIILDVSVNKDSVGQATASGFAINTKHVKTQVLIENGGTVVIGGIFELIEADTTTKVPLLGDIPVLGNAFKNKTRSTNKQEMLVFLTPRLIAGRVAVR